MNIKKKYMSFTKNNLRQTEITINNLTIQRTSIYKYLGTVINDNGRQQLDKRNPRLTN